MIRKATEFVKNLMAGDASGHDWFHTLRVLRTAETIAREEAKNKEIDMELVQLIALLHDVDDRKLSPQTHANLDNARNFLVENGVDAARMELILEGIRNLSFKGTGSTVPASIEGRIVQDADRLDAIGAIGIARAFAFGGSRGRKMYDPEEPTYAKPDGHTINHFYEKLLLLKKLMNTETGKAMAAHRHGYMEGFLEEFYKEWDGVI